jgi:hypothetical protein
MLTRSAPLATALLLAALLAAGCGGSDGTSGASSAPTATSTVKTDPEVASDPRVKQAIQRCKDTIEKNSQIADDVKRQFQAVCDQAASGDTDAVKRALRQVCEKIVNQSTKDEKVRAEGRKACAEAAG